MEGFNLNVNGITSPNTAKLINDDFKRAAEIYYAWTGQGDADMIKAIEYALCQTREEGIKLGMGSLGGEKANKLESQLALAREGLEKIMANIGVPQRGYPSPIAHAYEIAQQTLAKLSEIK